MAGDLVKVVDVSGCVLWRRGENSEKLLTRSSLTLCTPHLGIGHP